MGPELPDQHAADRGRDAAPAASAWPGSPTPTSGSIPRADVGGVILTHCCRSWTPRCCNSCRAGRGVYGSLGGTRAAADIRDSVARSERAPPRKLHFTAKNLVGFRNWFENVITSGPFFSVSPRCAIHSGSG